MNYPIDASLMDVARALCCSPGVISRTLGIIPVTGDERFRFDVIRRKFKCPAQFLANVLSGADTALTRQQTADMLGTKKYNLSEVHQKRATIVPLVHLGHGYGAGTRYSLRAVQAHLALEKTLPPRAPYGSKCQPVQEAA